MRLANIVYAQRVVVRETVKATWRQGVWRVNVAHDGPGGYYYGKHQYYRHERFENGIQRRDGECEGWTPFYDDRRFTLRFSGSRWHFRQSPTDYRPPLARGRKHLG